MKIKYYLMSMALMAVASVGFTSCSDDDDTPAPVENLTFNTESIRVKIGEATRVALNDIIETGAGEYNAFSLDKAVADIVEVDGATYIEGFKNGSTTIVVSDKAGTYKRIPVSVYTTDVMLLSTDELHFLTRLGSSGTGSASVLEGNGGYSIESDNDDIDADIDAETGEITVTATSRINEFTGTVTVTDCTGLTATMTVTVGYTLVAFTDEDIAELCAMTESTMYVAGAHDDHGLNEHKPYYFGYGSYGDWTDEDADGLHTFGWWFEYYGTDYGGLKVTYPAGTQLNQEVDGTWYFQYSSISWWPLHTFNGTVKVVKDDATSKVVIFYGVHPAPNQVLDYGYIVHVK